MNTLSVAARRGLAMAAALVLAGGLLAEPVTAAKPAKCQIMNVSAHANFATLQAAVDAASAGDTIRVKGTCIGSTTIAKSLTVVGHSNPGFGPATLDANHAGRVLVIRATATLRGLTITNGTATPDGAPYRAHGGGILNVMDSLTLVECTVVGNAASSGGGIATVGGLLTLDDSTVAGNAASAMGGGIYIDRGASILSGTSAVHHNTAEWGGGIGGEPADVRLNDTASVHDNTAVGDGGGIYTGDGSTTLNDASSVYNNTAGGYGGGIFNGWVETTLTGTSSIHHNMATSGGGIYVATLPSWVHLWGTSAVISNTPDNCYALGTVTGCIN